VWTQSAWSGCHKKGLRTSRGARPTRGDRVVSRHAVASRSRPPCLGRVISTTRARPETRAGPALPSHSQTRWGTTTLTAVGGGPCPGGGVAGGHHHARSCWWWALPGRGCGGGAPPRSQLLVVGPTREGVWRGATNILGACALATLSCPPSTCHSSVSSCTQQLVRQRCITASHKQESQVETRCPGSASFSRSRGTRHSFWGGSLECRSII